MFSAGWFLDWSKGDCVRIEVLDVGVKVCVVIMRVLRWGSEWCFWEGLEGLHFEVLVCKGIGLSVVKGFGWWRGGGEGHE